MTPLLDRILSGIPLTEEEAATLMEQWAEGEVNDEDGATILTTMHERGETADEVRGFARVLRARARRPPIPASAAPLVDTCGTGGDGSHSLNLSTGAALLAAAAGARVVKHGNRAVSSTSGSADVLTHLGVPAPLADDPADEGRAAADLLAHCGFTFLFAPRYHPAMARVAPVRRKLGTRTVFNMLGPLVNPAQPPFQLVGAWSEDAARLMAAALQGLGVERAFVVHGAPGWDEATPCGPYLRVEVAEGGIFERWCDPREAGLPTCSPEDLAGGDPAHNAARLRAALIGNDPGPHTHALALGAGLALEVCGLAPDTETGVDLALAAIEDGRAHQLLVRLESWGRRRG
ncbi:MAG: anthranilate phosphoribosyltransferase [Deltaproteobacteria bacterium]|nr:MAG: anthranilate phosphoribosyltransferase [Deltaproteobacteria bacterium]